MNSFSSAARGLQDSEVSASSAAGTRRKLTLAFGASVLAASLPAFAQQKGKLWRIGFLAHRRIAFVDSDYQYGAFRRGMREFGYTEGKTLVIEWRSAGGDAGRLPELAADLVKLKVDIIVAGGRPATAAAQKATGTIPIVMSGVADPVGNGFVRSLPRPGGNITGVTNINVELGPKQLETLRVVVPNFARVAVLINPSNGSHKAFLKRCREGAQKLGIKEVLAVGAQSPAEIEHAFSSIDREKTEALIVARDGFLNQQVRQVAELAAKNRLPAIGGLQEFVETGGLISYGPSISGQYHRAAYYVDRILRGAKPTDLPVEQPMTFELAVNMKTAKALGITMPPEIMVQATQVIQ